MNLHRMAVRSRLFCRTLFNVRSSPAYFAARCYGDKSDIPPDDPQKLGKELTKKYTLFQDEESPIILDIEEEKKIFRETADVRVFPVPDQFEDVNLERGLEGVFDIDDLVNLLKGEKAKDIFVARVPPDLQYVDYMVVVSGISRRHILGLAETVRKVFKLKMHSYDSIPRIEGINSSHWVALDLGNIALHIMSNDARLKYDLESLWSINSIYDPKLNEPEDTLTEIIQKHAICLEEFHPNQENT